MTKPSPSKRASPAKQARNELATSADAAKRAPKSLLPRPKKKTKLVASLTNIDEGRRVLSNPPVKGPTKLRAPSSTIRKSSKSSIEEAASGASATKSASNVVGRKRSRENAAMESVKLKPSEKLPKQKNDKSNPNDTPSAPKASVGGKVQKSSKSPIGTKSTKTLLETTAKVVVKDKEPAAELKQKTEVRNAEASPAMKTRKQRKKSLTPVRTPVPEPVEKEIAEPVRDSKSTPKKQGESTDEPKVKSKESHQEQGQSSAKRMSKPKSAKKKSPKKLPSPGRFDLRLPDRIDDAEKNTPRTKRVKLNKDESKSSTPATDKDSGTPQVSFNKRMTEAKLRLLNMSPLKRLIPEHERQAAANEVAATNEKGSARGVKRQRQKPQSELEDFLPLFDNDEEEDEDDEIDGKGNKEQGDKTSKGSKGKKGKKGALKDKGMKPDDQKEEVDVSSRGVMYLGHIPHGFYEKEMKGFFTQFGEVTRVRVSRSKKTGKSCGYAFVEFADRDVAAIAAEAMDGYMMMKRTLKAEVMAPEKVHPQLFKGCDRSFRAVPWSAAERTGMILRARDPVKLSQRSMRIMKSSARKQKALAKMGIEYEFPSVRFAKPVAAEPASEESDKTEDSDNPDESDKPNGKSTPAGKAKAAAASV